MCVTPRSRYRCMVGAGATSVVQHGSRPASHPFQLQLFTEVLLLYKERRSFLDLPGRGKTAAAMLHSDWRVHRNRFRQNVLAAHLRLDSLECEPGAAQWASWRLRGSLSAPR